MKILLAVDGSENSKRATERLIASLPFYRDPPFIEVLTVHLPIPHVPRIGNVVDHDSVQKYYDEECAEMMKPVCAQLDAANVRHQSKTRVGQIAQAIADEAKENGFDAIWMGTRGRTGIASLVLGSVATQVLHLAEVPVVLVR